MLVRVTLCPQATLLSVTGFPDASSVSPIQVSTTERSINLAQLNGVYTRKRYDYTTAGLPIWKIGQGADQFMLFYSVAMKMWLFSSRTSDVATNIDPKTMLAWMFDEVQGPAQELWALKKSSMEMPLGESDEWGVAFTGEAKITIRVVA